MVSRARFIEEYRGRYNGYVPHRTRLARVCPEKNMAAIDDLIGGVGNFKRVTHIVQWAAINRDRSRHAYQVDSGWRLLFNRGRLDVTTRFDGVAGRRRG